MIFFIEGKSGIGKSTLSSKILNESFNGLSPLYFKGAGQINIGTGELWEDYNWYMHHVIERIDELNNRKIPIIWDRGVSEYIITENEDLKRVIQCHKHKCLIYLTDVIEQERILNNLFKQSEKFMLNTKIDEVENKAFSIIKDFMDNYE